MQDSTSARPRTEEAPTTAIDTLRALDPDAFQRITVSAFALLAGGPVPCLACDVVAVDAPSWRHHVDTVHLEVAT